MAGPNERDNKSVVINLRIVAFSEMHKIVDCERDASVIAAVICSV